MSDDAQTPVVDLQDPLPESNWFWRRVFVFASILLLFIGISYILFQIASIGTMGPRAALEAISALLELGLRILWLSFIYVMFYLTAPSAEQVVKMIQTAALLRSGVQIASRSVQEDGRTEVAQTAGKPPQPVAPPVAGTPPSPLPPSGRGLPDEPSWSK